MKGADANGEVKEWFRSGSRKMGDGGIHLALAPTDYRVRFLALLFVVSGAAGLIYETVWTRYLGLFMGHGAYAQVLVLVIFLGAMAVGAFAVGRRSERIANPLLAYAGVELAIAVLGAVFHPVFIAVTGAAYESWFPAVGYGPAQLALKWVIAGALIAPQSILLGATFPLLTAAALRIRGTESGHALGLLYFANSIGAAGGVLLEGFYLIGAVGLNGTLLVAAALNAVVAAAVFAGAKRFAPADATPNTRHAAPDTHRTPDFEPRPPVLLRAMLVVAAGTALSSFVYEIAWIRMLSLVLGSATHAFELMLSAFVLGLALGAFWVRRRIATAERPLRMLGIAQWAMGVLAVATMPLYVVCFRLMSTTINELPETGTGYMLFSVIRYAMALGVMLPATFCAGMTLPLITHILLRAGVGERAVGLVYGVNTFGSIVGVALAALLLMPLIGLNGLLVLGAVIDIGIGIALVRWDRRLHPEPHARTGALPRGEVAFVQAVVLTFAGVAAIAYLARADRSMMQSAVYRHGIIAKKGLYVFPYYRDGRTATVSLHRVATEPDGMMTIATNGKPDASVAADWRLPYDSTAPRTALSEDMSTQMLLPLLALAHQPRARRVAQVGQGSGMTSHFVLGSDAPETVETIEIEPHMIAASRGFMPANRRAFEDPRSRFVIDDARSFLSANDQTYDLIMSEPSNPWVSGVASLFTVEFYERLRSRLTPTGIFAQWLHLYEIDDDLVASVLAAIDRTFPAYDVYLTSGSDIVILATRADALPEPDWSVVNMPGIAQDLRRVVPLLPEHFPAMRVAGHSLLHPYLATVAPNSDFRPVLDLGAERTRFMHTHGTGLQRLGADRFDIAAALDGRRRPLGTAPFSPATEIPRVNALAQSALVRLAMDGDAVVRKALSDSSARAVVQRQAIFDRSITDRSLPSPTDWRAWVQEFVTVEEELHGGSAGVADEVFYGKVRAFLTRTSAPATPRAAVDFIHGLAAWDFQEASRASDVLLQRRMAGEEWVPPTLLAGGAAVARIKIGDAKNALAVMEVVRRFTADSSYRPQTLRERALSAAGAPR
jgi:spermidine synthase